MANINHNEEINNSVHGHLAHIMESENNGMPLQFENGNHANGQVFFAGHHNHHHDNNEEGNEDGMLQNEEAQENADGEMEAVLPAWAMAQPVDGYIRHPVAGLIMHPSFYDNRHLINLSTKPRYVYDGEVDGPLCPPSHKCTHVKNCFEVRVRMAVLAYRMHHISFRDAEYIWRVSRSTIQRRKAALDKCSPIIFLVTPEHGAL